MAAELGLADGRHPAAGDFSRAAKKAALGWDSARVAKAWGSWRLATDAYLGRRVRLSPLQEAVCSRLRKVPRSRSDYIAGVAEWLATNPKTERAADYRAYVAMRNESSKEPPLVALPSVKIALKIGWADIKRVARGELDLDRAARTAKRAVITSFQNRTPYDLVAKPELSLMLGGGEARRRRLVADSTFRDR